MSAPAHAVTTQLLAWQPIEDILTDEDDEALKHLTGIMVEEREDPQEYKLCFVRFPSYAPTK